MRLRDSLKRPLEEINKLIEQKSIDVDGKNYALDFFQVEITKFY